MKRLLIIWVIVFSLIFSMFAQSVSADQIELPDVPIGGSGYTYHTVRPTCTEDGVSITIRNRDGAIVKQTPIPALGHDYISAVTAPGCTEPGYTTYTCSRCNDTYVSDHVDVLGHNFGEWTTVEQATCAEAGSVERVCLACGETETEELAALGHDYTEEVIPPTPNESGYTIHTCTRCDDSYIDSYTDPTGVYSLGDVNGDGKVNGDDVSDLSRYVARWPGAALASETAADVNGDGKVNGDDVSDLSRYVARWPGAAIGNV